MVSCISDWPQPHWQGWPCTSGLIASIPQVLGYRHVLCLCSVGDQIQDFVYSRQTTNWTTFQDTFSCFWDNISCYSGWPYTPYVAGIVFKLLTLLPPSCKCRAHQQPLWHVPIFQHWGGGDRKSSSQKVGGQVNYVRPFLKSSCHPPLPFPLGLQNVFNALVFPRASHYSERPNAVILNSEI